MSSKRIEPEVQSMLDEAGMLPECSAKNAILERAASRAESLGDLDTAWSARCQILYSSSAHEAPRFESLFMCLAWCLAVSDREPERFSASTVLWQYKWVATAAPTYARVPRPVLDRIISDMDERFIRAGWGRRAGLHKRLELHMLTGDHDKARPLVAAWRAAPRDRGSDCNACEASCLASLLADLGDDEAAIREARPIIAGRMSCATVPHSTFGTLLLPLTRLGRHAEARTLFDRGRRLVARLEEGGCTLSAPYFLHAAYIGETEQAVSMIRTRLRQAVSLKSDSSRADWFGRAALAMDLIARRGETGLDLPTLPGVPESQDPAILAGHFRQVATLHAHALDGRNGNDFYMRQIPLLAEHYGGPPPAPA